MNYKWRWSCEKLQNKNTISFRRYVRRYVERNKIQFSTEDLLKFIDHERTCFPNDKSEISGKIELNENHKLSFTLKRY
jgi:hypothetical protein